MQFFKRRQHAADAPSATGTSREKTGRRGITSRGDHRHVAAHNSTDGDGVLNKRPSFGQWLKVTWPDALTMLVMGIIGLGVCLNMISVRTTEY